MAESKTDHVTDVTKYTSVVDEAAVEGIVKHLGIALHSRDASLVAATDPEELKRLREGFLKKKLTMTESDADLDTAIQEVMTKMKGVHDKSRVTVCYLLADRFGKLGLFHAQ